VSGAGINYFVIDCIIEGPVHRRVVESDCSGFSSEVIQCSLKVFSPDLAHSQLSDVRFDVPNRDAVLKDGCGRQLFTGCQTLNPSVEVVINSLFAPV
jgi:hypothetical protein